MYGAVVAVKKLTTSIRESILADRQFRGLYAADATSKVGTYVSLVALPVLAQTVLHAGASQIGLLTALNTLPFLLIGLHVGAWLDRRHKRGILIVADLSRAVLVASIPVTWLFGVLTLAQLYAVAFLSGAMTVFFDIGHLSYLPHVVGRSRLTSANANLSGLDEIASVSGQGFGGFVVQLAGPAMAILVDAVSFVSSAIFISRIKVSEPTPERTNRRSLWREAAIGLRYVLADPVLRSIAIKGAIANLAGQMFLVSFLVLIITDLGLSAGTLGLVLAAGGVGSFCGALIAPMIGRRLGFGRGIWIIGMCTSPFALLIGLMNRGALLWIGAGGWVVAAVVFGLENVLGVSIRQTITPDGMLGRMNSGFRFTFMGALSVGAVAGGVIGSRIGVHTAIWTAAGVFAVSWLVIFFSPLRPVRRIDELMDRPTSSPVPQQQPKLGFH